MGIYSQMAQMTQMGIYPQMKVDGLKGEGIIVKKK